MTMQGELFGQDSAASFDAGAAMIAEQQAAQTLPDPMEGMDATTAHAELNQLLPLGVSPERTAYNEAMHAYVKRHATPEQETLLARVEQLIGFLNRKHDHPAGTLPPQE